MEEVEPLSQVNLIQSHCVPTCLCYIEGYDHKNKVSSPTNCKSFSLIWIGIINSSILVHAHYYNVTTHTHNYKIFNLVGTLLDKENSTHLFGLIYG